MFKRNFVINTKRLHIHKLDYQSALLFTLFICGLILGIVFIKNCDDDFKDVALKCLRNYISVKAESGFLQCFLGTLTILLLCVFFNLLFGLCAVGIPLIWLIPVCFGAFCGCGVSCFFINYGLKGLCYCALVNVPCYAITAATLIKCCCESTKMSINILNSIRGARADNIKGCQSFNDFLLNHLALCIPIVAGALLSAVGFRLFSSLFIFV